MDGRRVIGVLFIGSGLLFTGCGDDNGVGADETGETSGDTGDGLGAGCDENWYPLDGDAPPDPEEVLPELQALHDDVPVATLNISAAPTRPLAPPRAVQKLEREPLDLSWDEFVERFALPWPGGWLIDGDQFVSTEQLRDLHQLLSSPAAPGEGGLLAFNGGVFDQVWSEPRKLELTWCVGFVFPQPDDEDNAELHQARYERILAGMEHSTKAWERATGVNFVHLAELDDPAGGLNSGSCQPGQGGVWFRVRMGIGSECSGACAGVTNATPITEFDPEWAGPGNPGGFEREILFGPRGVHTDRQVQITARHELGHVLGFTHEHLAFDQDECTEDLDMWRPLTPPDPKSVMGNGVCPGIDPDQPRLSGFDRLGAFFQYSRARRNPLMMGGASSVDDYSYDGSGRAAIAWFTPLETSIQEWTSTASPGEAITFSSTERCLDGQPAPCVDPKLAVRMRPSPLLASGTGSELDLLMLGPGVGFDDRLISNNGANYSVASFMSPDFSVPIIGSFGHEIDDQIIVYQPGPAADVLFDPETSERIPMNYGDYAFPIPARFRGFGGGGNDILWYQPDAQTIEIWEWEELPEFSFERQGPVPPENFDFEVDVEYMPLIGDFNGDNRSDIFWYAPGETTDWLWLSISNQETALFERFERQVVSAFRPFVGDFNGDEIDDIFWYLGRSETPDALSVIWDFDEGGGHTPRTFSINGDYAPVVGDFDDDGCSDILWHDPASADGASPVWRCVAGEGFVCDPPLMVPDDAFPIGSGLYG